MKTFFLLMVGGALLLATSAHAQVNTRASSSPTPATVSQPIDCGCEDAPVPDVLAIVNGIRISKQDISAGTQKRINDLQQQVIDARKRELDLQINSLLLETEAKKRGVTTVKVLDDGVVAKTVVPTEADALAFYNENKARISSEFTKVKQDIISYLKDQRQQDAAKVLADRLRAAAALRIFNEPVTPGLTPAARARVFANVNGKNITSGDIEDSLKSLIYSVQESAYTLRKQEVEMKINDVLLQQEAKKRTITTAALLDAEVNRGLPVITEVEAQKFYNENKERLNGAFPTLKDQIIQYLKDQAQRNAETAFATRLRNSAQVQVLLTAPT